jgi:hypothetical protein
MRTNTRLCRKLLGVIIAFSMLGSAATARSWFVCIGYDGHVEVEEQLHGGCDAETGHSGESGFTEAGHDHGGCVDIRIEPQSVAGGNGSPLAVPSWQAVEDPPVTDQSDRHPFMPTAAVLKLLLVQRSVVLLI